MNLSELQEKLDSDVAIDPSRLLEEAANNLTKQSWWIRRLVSERLKVKAANQRLLEVMKDRYNYYAGYTLTPYEYNLDSRAIKYNLEGDEEVLEAGKVVALAQARLDLHEKACDLLVARNFSIKNMIELLKMQSGV